MLVGAMVGTSVGRDVGVLVGANVGVDVGRLVGVEVAAGGFGASCFVCSVWG